GVFRKNDLRTGSNRPAAISSSATTSAEYVSPTPRRAKAINSKLSLVITLPGTSIAKVLSLFINSHLWIAPEVGKRYRIHSWLFNSSGVFGRPLTAKYAGEPTTDQV